MIIIILSIFYAFYFIFIYICIKSRLAEEYNFGSASSPIPLPDILKPFIILLSIPFGLLIIAGIFWGFTTQPNANYLLIQNFWLWSRSDMELFFLIVILIALLFCFFVVYHCCPAR
jgi:hypothetical protein